jgi:hypothetical protein
MSRIVLLGIVSVYVAIAAMWVIRLPPFVPPDEMAHADYMFAFFDAGRFYKVASNRPGDEVMSQTRYVDGASGFRRLRYNPLGRVHRQGDVLRIATTVDPEAPLSSKTARPSDSVMPYVMFVYPSTYYVLLAEAVRAATFDNPRAALPAFFLARACNVFLGIGTLLLAFSAFRNRGLDARTSLLAVLGIAILPLFCWVTAYVQPDNLVMFCLTFAIWASRLKRHAVTLTGIGLCALCLVKPHYGLVVAIPCLAYALRGGLRPGSLRTIALLGLLPGAAIALALSLTPVTGGLTDVGATATSLGSSGFAHIDRYVAPIGSALISVYAGGRVFDDYWLGFGTRETYLSASSTRATGALFSALALAAIVVCGIVYAGRGVRIARVGARKSLVAVMRLVCGGLELNVYVAYSAFLILASVLEGTALGLQARYWLPLIVPATLLALKDLPCVLASAARPRASRVVASVVVLMALPVALASPAAIDRDFYAPTADTPRYDFGGVVLDGSGDADSFRTIERPVRIADRVTIRGFAIDVVSGLPADRVTIVSDGRAIADARLVHWKIEAAEEFHDSVLYDAGFSAVVPATAFGIGRHDVSVIVSRGGGSKRPLAHHVTLIVS